MSQSPKLSPLRAIRTDRSREIGLSLILALQIGILFVMAPLAATGMAPPLLIDLLRLGLAAAAVILLTRNLALALVISLTFLVSLLLSISMRSQGAAQIVDLERIVAASAFDLAISVAVASVAFGPGKVSIHRIMGAVILYLSIGLLFANAYRACALTLHLSFKGVAENHHFLSDSLYFSLATLTTTGFGDILPVHPFVRSLSNLEAVVGQLFPATLLARLVSLQVSAHKQAPASNT